MGVLGLGTVGLPTAVHISKFFRVKGYDLKPEKMEQASSSGVNATTRWSDVSTADIFVVCASGGTVTQDGCDVSAVHDLLSRVSHDNPSSLVCVESTVPVGTCRDISRSLGLKYVAHCPHRFWHGDPDFGIAQPRVLGAIDEESLHRSRMFYERLDIPVHPVSSIEVAEISKVAENAYNFVRISFAEDLCLACSKLGLSFDEVREACNTKLIAPSWKMEILEARDGIGGHCLPKDVRYLWTILKSPLLDGAMKVDEKYRAARIDMGNRTE